MSTISGLSVKAATESNGAIFNRCVNHITARKPDGRIFDSDSGGI
jgi:hypothetical protein